MLTPESWILYGYHHYLADQPHARHPQWLAAIAAPARGLCADRAERHAAGVCCCAALVAAALPGRARAGQPAWAAAQAPADRGRPACIGRAPEDRWASRRLGHTAKPARRAGALPRQW